MADSNSKKNEIKINTKLDEIYSKENIATIEPLYEDLRSKYNFLFKTDPTTIIRVPYTATLFGDTITHLFSNKIVTNLSTELIIIFNKNTTNELNIKYFDNIQEVKKTIGELNDLDLSDKEFNLNDFAILGYISALKHIKSNNNNFGSDVLITLNNPNREENDCYISIFLAMFLCSLYINDIESILKNSINKSTLYEMIILTLTEICEKNKKIGKLIDINYYTPNIYFKIFLERNSFGFNQGNLFYQSKISLKNNIPLSLLVFDSLSPEPTIYYSSSKYWNKRKVEVRLAMALMIKRFKENISQEDLIKESSSLESFLKVFENNYEIVLKSIDINLKKDIYQLKELKEELPVDKLLKDINNYQGALLTKEFKLYDRILFIIKEEQLVSLLYYKTKIGEEIDWKETLLESAKLLRENYYCYSDEMLNIEAELKLNLGDKIPIKCISKGWTGKMAIFGTNEELKKYEDYITKKYEKLSEGEGLAYAWIADDVNKYCFISGLEKGITVLDPKYEDFMLEYSKQKNIIEPPKVLEEKFK